MNISEKYFFEIDKVAQKQIPDEVIARAKRSLLDYLAVTCAGAAFQREKLKKYYDFAYPEEGEFKAIGTYDNSEIAFIISSNVAIDPDLETVPPTSIIAASNLFFPLLTD